MFSKSLIEKRLRRVVPVFNFIPPQKMIEYLRSRGIKLEGQKCYICGRKITLNNIGVVFEDGEHVIFICSDCLSKYNIFTLYRKFLKQTRSE